MKDIFSSGYDKVAEEVARQEREREERGYKLFRFFIPKGETEAEVIFLTDEPVTFSEYSIPAKTRTGKEYFENFIAIPNSKYAKDFKPSFKGAYLIYDTSTYEKDGEEIESGLKLYVVGQKVASQLERIYTKYPPLLHRMITIEKAGAGKTVSYTFERGEELDLDEDQISSMLPEKLQEIYDGTQESLMEIIKEQLRMYIEDDEDLPEEEEPTKKGSSRFKAKGSKTSSVKSKSSAVIGVEDDDDDEPVAKPKAKLFSASKKPKLGAKKESQTKKLLTKRGK
jgi:hypothetical protein